MKLNLILILLKPVNDEPPKALFQPLYVEFNKYFVLDNDTFFIVDLDSKPEDILISVEEYPRYGNENFNLNLTKNPQIIKKSKLKKKQENSFITTRKQLKITNSLIEIF